MRGTYVLLLKLGQDLEVDVGKLGRFFFPKGFYAYVGSACGKNINLETRIKRHRRLALEKSGKLHWHIDYILTRPLVSIEDDFRVRGRKTECKIAERLGRFGKIVARKFGSTDCSCKTHFFKIRRSDVGKLKNLIQDIRK